MSGIQTDLKAMSHNFIPLHLYICTLPIECFETLETTPTDSGGGIVSVPHANKLISLSI